jgi:uncharacterized protein
MDGRRYLIDTNVFIEILLEQVKKADCQKFIYDNFAEITISQFSLHSIALICYRKKSFDLFNIFLNDIVAHIPLITLSIPELLSIRNFITILDYDDAYQLITAQTHQLEITTLDTDFKKVQNQIKVYFL